MVSPLLPQLLRRALFSQKTVRRLILFLLVVWGSVLFSQDIWTRAATPTQQNLWSVCYGGSQFVAVGEGGTILTSTDGSAWTARLSGSALWLVGAGYGNGTFVVVGDQGLILTSTDGIAWTARTSGSAARLNGVAFGGGRWVAVAESGEVLTSTDGAATWTHLTPSPDRLRGVLYAYGEFVITGDNGIVRVTVNATDFSSHVLPDGLFVEAVTYAKRSFVAVGEAGYVITSPDAITWKRVASNTGAYLRGVTFFNNQFIGVGENGTVLTTPDPNAGWSVSQAAGNPLFTAVTATDTSAIAVGFGGTIMRSAPANSAPVIVTPPVSTTALAGDNVAFTVAARGGLPLAYQWKFNGTAVAGATSDTLLLSGVQAAQAGAYSVTVSNPVGSVDSAPAQLTIPASADPGPIVDSTFSANASFGAATALVEQSDGKIILGGPASFFVTAGVSPFALARLNLDGSVDSTFNIGAGLSPGGTVTALARQVDGKVIVGGSFTSFNGVARANLVRLNADGSVDTSFAPPVSAAPQAITQILEQADGKLVIASNNQMLRLNADGSVDATFTGPGATLPVTLFAPLPDGRWMAGNSLALRRLNANGTIDTSFGGMSWQVMGGFVRISSVLGSVAATADGKVLYLVKYQNYDQVTDQLLRLNSDGSQDYTWPGLGYGNWLPGGSPFGGSSTIYAPTPQGKVIAAEHAAIGYGISYNIFQTIGRHNADASLDHTFEERSGLPTGAQINHVFPLRNGQTLVTGSFATFDNVARPNIVRLVAANGVARQAPAIVSVTPDAVVAQPGQPVSLKVVATGTGPLTYTWSAPVDPAHNGTDTATLPTGESSFYYVTVTVSNSVGSVTSAPVPVLIAPAMPAITAQPVNVTVSAGRTVTLSVTAIGSGPFTYQWLRNGLPAGTGNPLVLTNVTAAAAGAYSVIVSNSYGALTSQPASVTVLPIPQLGNISTRASAGPGDHQLIAGFVVQGATPKTVLIRGIGPGLANFGIKDYLPAPVLTLYDSTGTPITTNSGWDATRTPASVFTAVGAFAITSSDAAFRLDLPAGNYTVALTDANQRTGTGLVEVYESDSNSTRLVNLSSRAYVGDASSPAIAGLVVGGTGTTRYLIRGVGPGLAQFGVTGTLADPVLTLTTASGQVIATNDNWSDGTNAGNLVVATAQAGAFSLAAGSKDAVLLVSLTPGNYTAIVNGANGATGAAIVEVYEVK